MNKPKPKTTLALGKSLIKNRQKQKIRDQLSQRHTTSDDPSNCKSITENTSLEEFLSTAEMANKQFIAERNLKLVQASPTTTTTAILPNYLDEDLESELLIPRRPKWDKNTTSEELKQLENESYLKWRRKLATLQERDDIVLTPFEKNLDFWRQLWRVVEKSDVLVQILDARNPLLFFCDDLEHYIKEIDDKKLNIILLNKADFLTEEQRKHWLNYFSSVGKVCVFFSALEQQEESINSAFEDTDEFHEQLQKLKVDNGLHMPLTYSELILYFKSLRTELGMSTSASITIGLVGYPNVGKSSTINSLLRTKKVSVSAMPGKTKHFQTIILDDEITICDCPGLVFPNIVSSKAEMIINGILPIDQMKNALFPISSIAAKIPAYIFESLYGIMLPKSEDESDDADSPKHVTGLELLSAYGYSRGFMSQRGLPDTSRAARYLLKDFVTGKLLYCYAPPNMKQTDFHIFPENNIPVRKITDRKLIRVYEGNNLTEKDFDVEYFRARNPTVHTKGSRGITNYSRDFADRANATVPEREGKPWKKHNNRNKKEKLRRVFSYLDE